MSVQLPPIRPQNSVLEILPTLAGLAIYLCPLVFFSRIPTQDGPLHIDTAAAMRESLGPRAEFFRAFLETRFAVETNTLGHDILFLALGVFESAVLAEKFFQLLSLVLFAGGAAYFLSGVRAGGRRYLPLLLPLGYGYIFHMGFYNNCLSISGFLWCWGALLRYDAGPSLAKLLILGCMTFLTWLAHPIGIVAFTSGAVFWGALELFVTREIRFMRRLRQLIVPELVVCAPLLSAAIFLGGRGEPNTWSYRSFSELTSLLARLSMMDSFALDGFSRAMVFASATVAVFTAIGAVIAIRMRRGGSGKTPFTMLLLTIFYLAVYYLAPWDAAGSGYINERLMPCVLFFAAALLASVNVLSRTAAWCGVAAIALLHYVHWPVYLQEELVERDYLFALGTLKPEAIVYPLHTASHGWNGESYASHRADFTAHLAGFYTAESGGLYLNNTIARWQEGRQISFLDRIAWTLDRLPAALPGLPTAIDFAPFEKAAGRPVDYVVLYGNFADPRSLARGYEEVLKGSFDCGLVSPRGLVKLCRHR